MHYIKFIPIYQERVWGGRNLESLLGRKLPKNQVIGESWEIVDRPEAQSKTSNARSLRDLIQADPQGIMGDSWSPDRPFPILVKWLDCQERLSLQVHPPSTIAPSLGGEPKTENWYIASAEPHATLMAGLKKGITKIDFESNLQSNTLEPLIHTIRVKKGESIFIPSGRIHAIGAGNLILEIQQNSDTTYRVYDWDRVGLDGKPRQLHTQESLESTNFSDFEPATLQPTEQDQLLVKSDVFNLNKRVLAAGSTLKFEAGEPRILSVVDGCLQTPYEDIPIIKGDNVLIPACNSFESTAKLDTIVLITDNFNH